MAIEIKLPDLGDGIDSGDILEILVQEGDIVAVDQSVIELETDKATVDVPSTHAGTVTKILVKTGQTVAIGDPLLSLEGTAADTSTEPPPTTDTGSSAPVSAPTTTSASAPPVAPPASPASSTDDDPVAAGPAIRRFAREVGVDLSHVEGSGEGGRITRDDVLGLVREVNQAAYADAAFTHDKTTPSSADSDEWGPVHFVALTKIRKTIAQRMHESWSTIPRVTNFDDADVTQLEAMRQTAKADYAKVGIKLTTTPFVVKSVAMALRSHPELNASLDLANDRIVYKDYINVGIAVDTERGLVVPSIRSADRLALPETARALTDLANNVRNGNFSVEDLRGGTFTISNLGAVGGQYSTPIVNPPEVAILLIGRSQKRPVVVDDEVQVRLMMPLSLSYDHRVVDGAVAARFLNDVIDYLESPSRALLAP